MELELHAARRDVFLCVCSLAVGSADRGERYCCVFLQVTEIKLCIFEDPLPEQRISSLLLPLLPASGGVIYILNFIHLE